MKFKVTRGVGGCVQFVEAESIQHAACEFILPSGKCFMRDGEVTAARLGFGNGKEEGITVTRINSFPWEGTKKKALQSQADRLRKDLDALEAEIEGMK